MLTLSIYTSTIKNELLTVRLLVSKKIQGYLIEHEVIIADKNELEASNIGSLSYKISKWNIPKSICV